MKTINDFKIGDKIKFIIDKTITDSGSVFNYSSNSPEHKHGSCKPKENLGNVIGFWNGSLIIEYISEHNIPVILEFLPDTIERIDHIINNFQID